MRCGGTPINSKDLTRKACETEGNAARRAGMTKRTNRHALFHVHDVLKQGPPRQEPPLPSGDPASKTLLHPAPHRSGHQTIVRVADAEWASVLRALRRPAVDVLRFAGTLRQKTHKGEVEVMLDFGACFSDGFRIHGVAQALFSIRHHQLLGRVEQDVHT
jgi:hypothetical protein